LRSDIVWKTFCQHHEKVYQIWIRSYEYFVLTLLALVPVFCRCLCCGAPSCDVCKWTHKQTDGVMTTSVNHSFLPLFHNACKCRVEEDGAGGLLNINTNHVVFHAAVMMMWLVKSPWVKTWSPLNTKVISFLQRRKQTHSAQIKTPRDSFPN